MYYHILIPVLSAIAMNAIIYTFGLNMNMNVKRDYLPPGYIIGIIWTIIFALLGYVHYLLYALKNKPNYGSTAVVFFILYSLAYPVINSSINNLLSLILSFVLSLIVMMYSRHIFLFMIPLLVWVSFVNLAVYDV